MIMKMIMIMGLRMSIFDTRQEIEGFMSTGHRQPGPQIIIINPLLSFLLLLRISHRTRAAAWMEVSPVVVANYFLHDSIHFQFDMENFLSKIKHKFLRLSAIVWRLSYT